MKWTFSSCLLPRLDLILTRRDFQVIGNRSNKRGKQLGPRVRQGPGKAESTWISRAVGKKRRESSEQLRASGFSIHVRELPR